MEDLAKLLRSATNKRGWVTKRINRLAGSVAALEVTPASSRANAQVAKDVQLLEDAVEAAVQAYTLYGVEADDNADRLQADTACSAMSDNATAAIHKGLTALADSDAAMNPPPAPAAQGQHNAPAAAATVNLGQHAANLKPDAVLASGATPAVVQDWKAQFEAYFTHLGAEVWPVRSQHALFQNAVDRGMWKALKRSLTFSDTAPVMSATPPVGNSIMELLDAHVQAENPIFNRRVDWYRMEQGQHETSAAFLGRLKEEAALAEIEGLTYDDTLVLRTLSGVSDRELSSELRKIDGINFTKVQARCVAYDREKREAKAAVRSPPGRRRRQRQRRRRQRRRRGSTRRRRREARQANRGRARCRSRPP